MKFIVDAQIPRKISYLLIDNGFDSIHTLDLPNKNATTDDEINKLSIRESRIVITKDMDFFNSFFISNIPYKLLLISTGNIRNNELFNLIENSLKLIVDTLSENNVIEINRERIIIRN